MDVLDAMKTSINSRRHQREMFLLLREEALPSSQGIPVEAARRRDGPPGRLYKLARLGELSNLVALFQIALLGCALLAPPILAAEAGTKDQDLFNQGKVLMFDKKWDDARAAFQRLLQEFPNSNFVPQANYFGARCLQAQGKDAEALRAYEFFLQKYAQESYLQVEARNA